jgi:protein-L-isoaspartate(D-aspartate) O-methyltransferase
VRVQLGVLPLVAALLTGVACPQRTANAGDRPEDRAAERRAMVRHQIARRGVKDRRVLAAMTRVKRHLFVPAARRAAAYADHPLPIGEGQTISQPYIVAAMTEALALTPGSRVLEIGTGSGYQAAILGELAGQVYTIEIVPALGRRSRALLRALGYKNVHVRTGDGYAGWPDKAPFDAVILTAAPPKIPAPLIHQLKVGGHLVAPAGPMGDQRLFRLTKTRRGVTRRQLMDVRFVPMTGRAQQER